MDDGGARHYEFKIQGTHCAACSVLIERELKQVPGVHQVKVHYSSGRTELVCDRHPDIHQLDQRIKPHGYRILDQTMATGGKKREYAQLGAIVLIVTAGYFLLRQINLLPSIGVSETMSYGVVFIIGLVAAVSTCMAVTGGLLLAVSAKYNEQHPELTGKQRFRAHLYFNAGRIVSYTVLGGAVGALGSVLSLSSTVNGIVTIVVSLIMVILGVQLLNIFPWLARLLPRMPKFIAHRIYDSSAKQGKAAPFLFGALTFFLPCGFTQALQLYVLSKGSFMTGAVIMFVFTLGTLPALLSVSAMASFLKGAWQKYFLKFAGVLVVLIGLLNISRGFALTGINRSDGQGGADTQLSSSEEVDGVQVVKMTVDGYDYYPSHFTVKKGIPVEWQIDARKAAGCAGVITMPKMNITEILPRNSIKTITFTPTETGTLNFSCMMGMTTPGAAFTVVESGIDTDQPVNTNASSVPKDLSKCDPTTAMCVTN
jgi:sulfite exporter TauE/SafE/copper chaperone CopZ